MTTSLMDPRFIPPARSLGFAVIVVVAFVVVLAIALHPRTASAQSTEARDAEARSLFEAGRLAMEDGRYEEALDHFERSLDLSGRPVLWFNIGSVADRLRQDEKAIHAYERYLDLVPEAANAGDVRRRLEVLRRAVEHQLSPFDDPPSASSSVFEKWWFWTIVAVVVVGAGVAIGVGVAAHDPGVQAPLPGQDGVVIMALDGP